MAPPTSCGRLGKARFCNLDSSEDNRFPVANDTVRGNSDDADSPITSDTDDDDGDDKQRKKKKKRTIRYPRYNASSLKEGIELQVGLMFINKEQLRDAVEDYRIMKGYDIRIQYSDKKDFKHFAMQKDVNGVCGHLDHNSSNKGFGINLRGLQGSIQHDKGLCQGAS
ncbi:hypothetical protein Cgig2_020324 [Carnegiea gigantea]|uniref:Uncharacterized protein n=1 Tax=Carnegiea gigantea TaxID=171969 RepID=A0A9Q1JM65_9CARY|nr:hypothetical protein Cgig2_020324 [Carnegiea gigantea]